MSPKVLIIDDEEDLLDTLQKVLERKGFEVTTARSGRRGLELAATLQPDVVLVDLRMTGMDGLAALSALHRDDPDLPVVLMTAFSTVQTAVAAVREGAFDYIAKPFGNDEIELVLRRALEHRRLVAENRLLHERIREREAFSAIVGQSPQMRRLLNVVEKLASSDANALILGESGTGKELVARAIHAASSRRGAFVPVDCAALPENLLESELFGYERGAFTGATHSKVGLLEHAAAGTLFLDEVAELAVTLQSKLLRALQERSIRRLGGTELREVDVRIISATNRDIDALMRSGEFREDIYYRLKVVTVEVPPLREREGDVSLLAQHFFNELRHQASRPLEGFSSATMLILESYSWPGNVRELRNVVERAITLSEGTQIGPRDLPPSLLADVEGEAADLVVPAGDFQSQKQALVATFEREYLERALRETNGNVAEAARRAGMERAAFHRLMRRHDLEASPYRKT